MWSNIKKVLSNSRELFWPLLEPLDEVIPKQINESDCNWENEDTDMILKYVENYMESEDKRRKEVESKSTLFIGSFGVATAVLINMTNEMIFNTPVSQTPLRLLLICMMTLAIVYLCRAIWFSIKVLERRKYYTTGFPGFMLSDSDAKKQQLIIRQYNNTKKNQEEINIKVDFMTMAQEYFKRAIVIVTIFSGIVMSNYIVTYKAFVQEFLEIIDKLTNSKYLLIGVFSGILLLFLMVAILFDKLRKIEKNQANTRTIE